jgi:hypothetical protein
MSDEVKFIRIGSGYKEISFIKTLTDDGDDYDLDVTLVIKESGHHPLHIRLSPDEVTRIIKGFNWSKKINKEDK